MANKITVQAVSLQMDKFVIDATFPLLQFIIQQGNSSLSMLKYYE